MMNKIKPYINCDGYYPQCPKCWKELKPYENVCEKCKQLIDWDWLNKEVFDNDFK